MKFEIGDNGELRVQFTKESDSVIATLITGEVIEINSNGFVCSMESMKMPFHNSSSELSPYKSDDNVVISVTMDTRIASLPDYRRIFLVDSRKKLNQEGIITVQDLLDRNNEHLAHTDGEEDVFDIIGKGPGFMGGTRVFRLICMLHSHGIPGFPITLGKKSFSSYATLKCLTNGSKSAPNGQTYNIDLQEVVNFYRISKEI